MKILLNEARIRLNKTKGNPTISDIREFSRYARKLYELAVDIIRVGWQTRNIKEKIEDCKDKKRAP